MGEVIKCGGDSGGCWFFFFRFAQCKHCLPQPPALVTVPAVIPHDLLTFIRDVQTHVSKKIQWLICMGLGLPLIVDLLVFPVICQTFKGYRGVL